LIHCEEASGSGIRHFSAGLFGTLEKIVPKVTVDEEASIATNHHM
jgi:hypothetical protein